MNHMDYYKRLGLKPEASQKEIKEAYRRKAFEFHPDRNQQPEAATIMQGINEAYAVLSDPSKRRQYDGMRSSYGESAHHHFRQSYSEQDIFTNSDFQQIFEEVARAFGLRGFDEIFKDLQSGDHRGFQHTGPGFQAKGFVFRWGGGRPSRRSVETKPSGVVGKLARKLLEKTVGLQFPQHGRDSQDVIELTPEFAAAGGPYAYFQQTRHKKLVVQIPAGVKEGQQIRLAGMGQEGVAGGENGDLYLKVKIRRPFIHRLKSLFGK